MPKRENLKWNQKDKGARTMKSLIKTKKTLIAAALLSYFSYVPTSSAIVLPSIDIAVLTETMAGNIQELKNWMEQKAMMKINMELESVYSAMGIDNDNARSAQEINAAQTAEQKKAELQALKESAPTNNACTTLGNQAMGAAVSCDAANMLKSSASASSAKRAGFSATPTDVKKIEDKINKKIVDECSQFVDDKVLSGYKKILSDADVSKGGAELTPADLLALSKCMQPSEFMGGGGENGDLLSPDQVKAANHFKELIIGPTPKFKSSSLLNKESESYKKQAVEEARIEAFRNLAELSFSEIISMKNTGDNGNNPSQMFVLQDFSDQRYGDEKWVAQIMNVDGATKNSVQPPEVLRHIAVMDSFMIHLELIKYKQQLRMEALQAATLALMIDPPKR
jgi:hypothetical protein